MIANWYPGVGDPTVRGWVTALAYISVSFFCFRLSFRHAEFSTDRQLAGNERILWTFFAVILFFLGINKQLDLQTLMIESLKVLSTHAGWYRQKHAYQLAFIVVLCLILFSSGIYALSLTRGLSVWVKVAVLGVCIIALFILIRASSFNRIYWYLGVRLFRFRMIWILELGGIGMVFLGQLFRGREIAGMSL